MGTEIFNDHLVTLFVIAIHGNVQNRKIHSKPLINHSSKSHWKLTVYIYLILSNQHNAGLLLISTSFVRVDKRIATYRRYLLIVINHE